VSRILLSLYHGGFLRHYAEPVKILAERGHHVTVAVGRFEKDAGDLALVEKLRREAPGVEIVEAPFRPRDDPYRAFAWMTRSLADLSRYAHPRYRDAQALRARMAEALDGHLRSAEVDRLTAAAGRLVVKALLSRTSARLANGAGRFFVALHDAVPPSPEITTFIRSQAPDAVAAAPVVELGSAQVEYLTAARALGVPVAVCIASWDNLTNKGLMRIVPDLVVVWNEIQQREAVELHGVPAGRIVTTGAQRFDWWWERAPSRSSEAFGAQIGLDPSQRYILYVCSSPFIAPDEVTFVREWLRELRSAEDEQVARLGVLIRPHPQNAAQWSGVDLSDSSNVVVYPTGGAQADDENARDDYFDSLYHAAAVVGINTSAQVEAGILGKTVLTVAHPSFAGTQDGTLHFRYLRWENGGNVRVASSFSDHLDQLARTVSGDDAADRKHVLTFARMFLRPHDTPSAPLVADALEALAASGRRPAPDPTPTTRLVRPLLRVAVSAHARLNRAHAAH
jgi:hypothetical protein